MNSSYLKELILRCRKSPIFFMENFLKVKHPKAGIIPLKLFKYQRGSIKSFMNHKFVIYKKTRQAGISTLCGAYALWYAMLHSYKTVLVVSKRDDDAMDFLNKNVKFPYDNLPDEIKEIWGVPPPIYNEHQIGWKNGSYIKSL